MRERFTDAYTDREYRGATCWDLKGTGTSILQMPYKTTFCIRYRSGFMVRDDGVTRRSFRSFDAAMRAAIEHAGG